MNLVWVGFGGSLGAVARYLLGRWITNRTDENFPWGTLFINVSGSFLLGLLIRILHVLPVSSPHEIMLFMGVGFCGAYTTFSTFSYETWMLIREGQTVQGLTYVGLTLSLGVAAAGFGLYGLR